MDLAATATCKGKMAVTRTSFVTGTAQKMEFTEDYKLDTLQFLVPFASITTRVDGEDVVVTSDGPGLGRVRVTLYEYAKDNASRHLVIVTEDGITFALPPSKKYMPTPIAIDKSRVNNGQFIDLNSTSSFSEVKTVYSVQGYQNHIVGNQQKNTIVGGSKIDLLEGLGGDDVLKGGAGNDVLDGGPGDDSLVGGPGNDTLKGGADDDIIAPGPGQNLIYGGDGVDTVVYNEDNSGIEVLLSKNMVYHPHHGIPDRIYEVENAIGTVFDDILEGDDQDNVLTGNGGNDQLYTGKSGYDVLDGGNGSDIYSWNYVVTSFASVSTSTMIIQNYATDGAIDTIENDVTINTRSEIGFDYDLVIRPINQQHPVFYESSPIIIRLEGLVPPRQPRSFPTLGDAAS